MRSVVARQKTSRKAEEDSEERGGGKFESVASEELHKKNLTEFLGFLK